MQSASSVRGYSDFFASGFRAVTTRRSPSSPNSHENDSAPSSSTATRRILADITQRRGRPTSMLVQSTAPKPTPREKTRGRRSSFISFSSRLFDRMTSSSNDENSTVSSSRRTSRRYEASIDSAHEVWIAAGGPYTPSAPNGSAALWPIDPFTSSPDARSMFIDLSSDSSGSPTGTPKREQSFLSLTGSSSNRSSFIFGTRRERPTSIHTMPLPSRSRRSSFQYRPPPVQEKSDFFWIAEEEPAGLAAEPILEHPDEWDAPSKIDWRQFHIDILSNDHTTQ